MSNSFLSPAARENYDQTVSTYVDPVTTQPKSRLVAFAETLASVNKNLRPFLNQSIEKGVEKEKRKAAFEMLSSY